MTSIAFFLELTFAALLGISGVTKIDTPWVFQAALLNYKFIPSKIVPWIARIFPWFEIILAALLMSGVVIAETSVINLILFLLFFILKVYRLLSGQQSDCGCHGPVYTKQNATIDLWVGGFYPALALAHVWFATHSEPIIGSWRFTGLAIFACFASIFAWRVIARHKQRQRREIETSL
jgi:hypothetical protein